MSDGTFAACSMGINTDSMADAFFCLPFQEGLSSLKNQGCQNVSLFYTTRLLTCNDKPHSIIAFLNKVWLTETEMLSVVMDTTSMTSFRARNTG